MNSIEIRQPRVEELDRVQRLRHAVLDPARRIATDHELAPEDFSDKVLHMAAFDDEEVVGTVRLDPVGAESGTYEVRKMAVDPAYRGRGVGRMVLEAAIAGIEARGGSYFSLDAREEAVPFFERLGFRPTGERITHEDGVPNSVMRHDQPATCLATAGAWTATWLK